MADLASAVRGAVGQPASVRIGIVDSLAPLVISAQGAPFDDVGLLGSYVPQVGDTVAMLGQSTEVGSDPASWLALGNVESSAGAGNHGVRWLDAVNVGTFSSGAVSAQTNLSAFQLTADLVEGMAYLIHVQFQYSVTAATDNWRVRVRRDTALTGGEVAQAQFSGANLLNPLHLVFPYYPTGDQTGTDKLLFFSVERVSGAGTITVNGSPGGGNSRSWSGIESVGATSVAGGVWRTS